MATHDCAAPPMLPKPTSAAQSPDVKLAGEAASIHGPVGDPYGAA